MRRFAIWLRRSEPLLATLCAIGFVIAFIVWALYGSVYHSDFKIGAVQIVVVAFIGFHVLAVITAALAAPRVWPFAVVVMPYVALAFGWIETEDSPAMLAVILSIGLLLTVIVGNVAGRAAEFVLRRLAPTPDTN